MKPRMSADEWNAHHAKQRGLRDGQRVDFGGKLVGATVDRVAFTLEGWPPSLHRYTTNRRGGGRVKTTEAREYQARAESAIRASVKGQRMKAAKWYAVAFTFLGPRVERKDGEPRKLDVTNRVKAVEDALAKAIGIDDSRFNPVRLVKRWAETESVVIEVKCEQEATQ